MITWIKQWWADRKERIRKENNKKWYIILFEVNKRSFGLTIDWCEMTGYKVRELTCYQLDEVSSESLFIIRIMGAYHEETEKECNEVKDFTIKFVDGNAGYVAGKH